MMKNIGVLRPHWYTRIGDLEGDAKEQFDQLSKLVIQTYHKTEEYRLLLDRIRNEFGDLISSNQIEAGTVSGYIAGCMIERHFETMQGCGIYCAENAIPTLEGIVGCSHTVLKLNNEKIELLFRAENNTSDTSNTAILYVPSTFNFSLKEEDKRELRDTYGIEKLHVLKYDGTRYEELWSGFRPLDEIKEEKQEEIEVKGRYVWFIVIIIVFVFFIIIGCVLWYRRR